MLANTVRGPSALLLRRAYVACILTILLYASPVWWRGVTRQLPRLPRPRSEPLPARSVRVVGAVELAKLTEAVQNVALRLILPAWRTTPIVALQCEASLPPVRLVLNYLRALYGTRLHTLPAKHPISLRLSAAVSHQERANLLQVRRRTTRGNLTTQTTPLLEMGREVEGVERHGPGPTAPWEEPFEKQRGLTISLFEGSSKETVAAQHEAIIGAEKTPLVVYSDGFLSTDGNAGAGFVLYRAHEGQREKVLESSIHLHRDKEVFDAEAFALFTGLKTAFTAAEHLDSTAIIVFIDNQAVLRALKQHPRHNGSSGSILALTRREPIKWLGGDATRSVHLAWVPGHCSIEGNDRADTMAKKGSSALRADIRVGRRKTSVAKAKRRAKERLLKEWKGEWDRSSKHGSYRRLRTRPPSLTPAPYLGSLPRRVL
ncbi:hypothetical protein CF328_g9174, partial [Tilletia controversa]